MRTISERNPLRILAMPGVTGLIWAIAAASVVFWVLMWPTQQAGVALVPVAATQTKQDTHTQTAKALGRAAASKANAELPVNSPFKLMGVIVNPSGQGSALISVNGLPPRPYKTGEILQNGWLLHSLTSAQAHLKIEGAHVVLEMPITTSQSE
jgi:general secretion pathway protein C